MRRKTAKKEKKDAKNATAKPGIDARSGASKEERANADYGGIPDRDLKKNLGCG